MDYFNNQNQYENSGESLPFYHKLYSDVFLNRCLVMCKRVLEDLGKIPSVLILSNDDNGSNPEIKSMLDQSINPHQKFMEAVTKGEFKRVACIGEIFMTSSQNIPYFKGIDKYENSIDCACLKINLDGKIYTFIAEITVDANNKRTADFSKPELLPEDKLVNIFNS